MAATLKYWTGSAWAPKTLKYWNGSAWVAKPLKYWNGSAWIGPATGSVTAPVFRSKTNRNYPGGAGIIYVDKPAGTVENDILFVLIFHAKSTPAQNELIPLTSFTRVGTSMTVDDNSLGGRLELWWRRMTASEPANYGFDIWGSNSNEYYAASYSGCPTSGSPIDVLSQNSHTTNPNDGKGATATVPSVTTTQANDKLLWFGHNWDASGTLPPPSGMTERNEFITYAADETIAAAGATGDRTQTQVSNNPWAVYLVALKGV